MNTRIKCNNGTFIGKETDELIIWKGIPYATQPLGNFIMGIPLLPAIPTLRMKPRR